MDCRPSKVKLTAAKRARAARWSKKQPPPAPEFIETSDSDSNSDIECTGWTGGVSHIISDYEDSDAGYSIVEDGFLEELGRDDLIEGLQREWQNQLDLELLAKPTATEVLMREVGSKQWKAAESNRSLGYNELSERCQREIRQKAREKEVADKITRNTNSESKVVSQPENSQVKNLGEIFHGYLSDMSEDEGGYENEENEENEGLSTFITAGSSSASITPALKRQKVDIPACDQHKLSQEARCLKYQEGLAAIDKLIASKKEHFDTGHNGLQAS
ncbi:hypothetical protein M422DRAFT_250466 [Sphaerobolus stellatus SS14]|uniref:Uncharacterized protein n=1 Tax=Sphaerobolus stellatus (strain SS14) TaxID=990650 RepID=A0A0C9VG99_SPHS4|nr:hypothetical protein M422DRAFT_250466 [Sphaerobolus stellatus SS14]